MEESERDEEGEPIINEYEIYYHLFLPEDDAQIIKCWQINTHRTPLEVIIQQTNQLRNFINAQNSTFLKGTVINYPVHKTM